MLGNSINGRILVPIHKWSGDVGYSPPSDRRMDNDYWDVEVLSSRVFQPYPSSRTSSLLMNTSTIETIYLVLSMLKKYIEMLCFAPAYKSNRFFFLYPLYIR